MKKLLPILSLSLIAAVSARATPVLPGTETSLQSILDSKVVGTTINVNTDQNNSDSYFAADSAVAAYMLIEIAGYAGDNTFGIYKVGSPGTTQEIFSGSVSDNSSSYNVAIQNSWAAFGFYIYNPVANFTWYSDSTLNVNGGLDHFVSYQGAAGATLNGWTFDANDFVIAMEDLNLGDKDYNDMVVLVQNVRAVPDGGATVIMLGLAFSGLALLRRRKVA